MALKKNPKLGDSTTVLVPYYKDTTIVINIIGDTSDQTVKFKKWYKQAMDSVATVFNDSFVQVNQTIDSLGNLKTNVIRKPFKESVKATIKGEAEFKIPPMIVLKEEKQTMWQKIKSYAIDWLAFLGIIFIVILLFRKLVSMLS
jgi:ABC-type proline/glycine betaine transport system permease subunit